MEEGEERRGHGEWRMKNGESTMKNGEERTESRGWMRDGLIVALVGCLLLGLVVPVLAQVSSNYDLSWHAIAGGGGRMESAGGHAMLGTGGQSLVGPMESGGHALCGGFWCGAAAQYRVYLPLVVHNF